MIAMVVAHANERIGQPGRRLDRVQFRHADGSGLFDKHMLAAFHCRHCDGGQRGVERGVHHHIDVWRADGLLK